VKRENCREGEGENVDQREKTMLRRGYRKRTVTGRKGEKLGGNRETRGWPVLRADCRDALAGRNIKRQCRTSPEKETSCGSGSLNGGRVEDVTPRIQNQGPGSVAESDPCYCHWGKTRALGSGTGGRRERRAQRKIQDLRDL